MKRKKHPNKEIEMAIIYGEKLHWRYRPVGNSSHAWGRLLCPFEDRNGCRMSIWSTPKNAETHAKQVRKKIDACPHMK